MYSAPVMCSVPETEIQTDQAHGERPVQRLTSSKPGAEVDFHADVSDDSSWSQTLTSECLTLTSKRKPSTAYKMQSAAPTI